MVSDNLSRNQLDRFESEVETHNRRMSIFTQMFRSLNVELDSNWGRRQFIDHTTYAQAYL